MSKKYGAKKKKGLKLNKQRILCRVRWFDKRDGNGIAYSLDGTEFYIDISSISARNYLKSGEFISLRHAYELTDSSVGGDVKREEHVSEIQKSLFQVADSLRFTYAQINSALNQVNRIDIILDRNQARDKILERNQA